MSNTDANIKLDDSQNTNSQNTNFTKNKFLNKFQNILNNYGSIIIIIIIILLSIIIQVGYYIAWMLCDTYFFTDK
jgi:hypothetical protein